MCVHACAVEVCFSCIVLLCLFECEMFYVTLCAYLGVFSLEMFPSVHDLPVYIVTHKSGWISTFCLL